MAEVQIQSLSHRHKEIADWLFANPQVKNLQHLCNAMNISRSWLSIVMRSDVFREYFDRRRNEHEKDMRQRLVMRQLDVTLKALDRIDNLLDDDDIEDRLAFDIANKTAQNLGYAPSRKPQVTEERIQELTRTVDAGTLAQARETIRLITRTEHAALPAPDSE